MNCPSVIQNAAKVFVCVYFSDYKTVCAASVSWPLFGTNPNECCHTECAGRLHRTKRHRLLCEYQHHCIILHYSRSATSIVRGKYNETKHITNFSQAFDSDTLPTGLSTCQSLRCMRTLTALGLCVQPTDLSVEPNSEAMYQYGSICVPKCPGELQASILSLPQGRENKWPFLRKWWHGR